MSGIEEKTKASYCFFPLVLSDLIRMIMKDAKNFDPRAWIVAVGIVLSAFVILSLGICIVLYKEWQEDEDVPGMEPRTTCSSSSSALQVAFLLLVSATTNSKHSSSYAAATNNNASTLLRFF